MDENEHDQLNDIHDEVKGSHAQLGAINERTRNIEQHLNSIADDVEENSQDVDLLEGKVKRNTTILNGLTVGLSGLLLWSADKLAKVNPL